MKVAAHKIYTPVFVVLLLLQLYLPSFKANIFLQIATLLLFVVIENVKLSVQFFRQVMPLVLLLFLGFIGTILHRYRIYDVLKDIFHFLKPIVGLLVGYIIARRINNITLFVRAIVIACIVSAVIHFGIIAVMVRNINYIESIREFTKDNFLELFGIFFIIFFKKLEGRELIGNVLHRRLCLLLLSVSCILYFSRTMIILAIILIMAFYGYTRITRTTIKVFAAGGIAIIALFAYLNTANIKRDARGLENFLYKIKNAPGEIFETNINRENHADLWDHWRAYEAKRAIMLMNEEPQSYVYGTGYGSLVNLKFFAPLTGDDKGIRYISDLHNGYINILYKLGIIGLIIYISLLIKLYRYINRGFSFAHVMVSSIGLIYIITSVMITGMYNGRDIMIFILGGVIYHSTIMGSKGIENKLTDGKQ